MTRLPRASAQELVRLALSRGSSIAWDKTLSQPNLGEEYARELAIARSQTTVEDSVFTGEGTLGGRGVALIIGEFGFLAGSIGSAAADPIVDAFRRAKAKSLRSLAAPVSGGPQRKKELWPSPEVLTSSPPCSQCPTRGS